ncbi:adenylate/guanylate cyclase domain-containing protein [Desulfococcaceae bacterium HSG8]|nr:adenylate/guanylate cyclase domain-containing protein [Desulfococcaceae bacterium HSG8]
MIVTCENEKCQAAFQFDSALIKPDGTLVRCGECKHVFRIYPEPEAPPEPDEEPQVPIYEPPAPSHKSDVIVPPEPKPETESPVPRVTEEEKKSREDKRAYIPFKTKLVYFAAILISVIGIIVIPIEIYRPMAKLFELIGNTQSLLGGVQASFDPEELKKMNRFALDTIEGVGNMSVNEHENRDYFFLSFNMLLTEGEILPEDKLPKDDDGKVEIEGFEESFDYKILNETQYYWKMRFAESPGLFKIFSKYKNILIKAQENVAAAGFDTLSAVYVMIDSGKKEDFFKDNIAFLLDGYHWSEAPSYVGEPYEISDEYSYWRALALNGKEGYDTSPTTPKLKNWGLPDFAEDEWGAWFTVWLTKKNGKVYNVFCVDFDASVVKKLMVKIAIAVGSATVVLAILVFLIATFLSRLVTRPITSLTEGAREVSQGNYEHEVTVFKEDEFGELTRQFNMMTRGQKERLNLEVTLKKFLGEALLGRAKGGLGFEGRREDCTIMFTDFGGFSTITQKMTASESIIALNTYFGALIPVLQKYEGFADKYIGDAIVAIFGAPVPLRNHAESAVCAAVAMQLKIREINDKRRNQVCLVITERSLEDLGAGGIPAEILDKLRKISKDGLDILKSEGISDETLYRLKQIKDQEFVATEELLEGEFLDTVLRTLVPDEQKADTYRSLILELTRKQERGLFEMRIGLNSGEVIVGALGCDEKLEYTSIGETTNLANRMEASCKIGHVAIAKGTYERVKNIFFPGINISATPEYVEVKGMGRVPVYRIYLHNLTITKDMNMKDNIKKFYVYEETDHQLKYSPEDVPGVTFESVAEFVE